MRVAVIDYGIGNVQSVVNACRREGVDAERVTNGSALSAADPSHILLPGVGAVGAALDKIRAAGLDEALEKLVIEGGRPFLGICVGMQCLAKTCNEYGSHEGLGWIDGSVDRLAETPDRPVPHVGWNTVSARAGTHDVIAGADGQDFYFVHSFAMRCDDAQIAGETTYAEPFVSAVQRDNILGVQFHPEKSARAGHALIKRFLDV